MTDFQSKETNVLPRSVSALGCFCEKRKEGNWRIYVREHQDYWYFQQESDRWLLVIHGVPQILLHPAEVIAFIKRWKSSQQEY